MDRRKIKSRRAERFVASLLALTSFGSYNNRICGSLRSPKPLRASHIRQPLNSLIILYFCSQKSNFKQHKEVKASK